MWVVVQLLVLVVLLGARAIELQADTLYSNISIRYGEKLQYRVQGITQQWPYEVRLSYPAYVSTIQE